MKQGHPRLDFDEKTARIEVHITALESQKPDLEGCDPNAIASKVARVLAEDLPQGVWTVILHVEKRTVTDG